MREVNLKNKTVAVDSLENFGFIKTADGYRYEKNICDDQLTLTLKFTGGKLFSAVNDVTGEEYTLHLVESSSGSFVGAVRKEYEDILTAFVESCCVENIFTAQLTKNLLDYVGKKYFPAYHMNKKSWYTIKLDGTVDFDEICKRLADSYKSATK